MLNGALNIDMAVGLYVLAVVVILVVLMVATARKRRATAATDVVAEGAPPKSGDTSLAYDVYAAVGDFTARQTAYVMRAAGQN